MKLFNSFEAIKTAFFCEHWHKGLLIDPIERNRVRFYSQIIPKSRLLGSIWLETVSILLYMSFFLDHTRLVLNTENEDDHFQTCNDPFNLTCKY